MELIDIIKDFYVASKLRYPTFDDAMKFVHMELAEALEVDIARKGYERNNPEKKPKFSKVLLEEELGDAIRMIMVAGILEGVNPLDGLIAKLSCQAGKDYRMCSESTEP